MGIEKDKKLNESRYAFLQVKQKSFVVDVIIEFTSSQLPLRTLFHSVYFQYCFGIESSYFSFHPWDFLSVFFISFAICFAFSLYFQFNREWSQRKWDSFVWHWLYYSYFAYFNKIDWNNIKYFLYCSVCLVFSCCMLFCIRFLFLFFLAISNKFFIMSHNREASLRYWLSGIVVKTFYAINLYTISSFFRCRCCVDIFVLFLCSVKCIRKSNDRDKRK